MNRRGAFKSPALSPVLINRIARYLFNGFDDFEVSVLTGLGVNTIKELRGGKSDTRVKYQFLILKNAAIERVIKGRGKLSGLMWFLERRWPRQYARADVQLTLASGTTTNNTLIVSAEVAESLVARSKTVIEDIDQLIRDKNPDVPSDAE